LRVVLFKDQLGIFHATLAQLFFVTLCAIALLTSPWWLANTSSRPSASIPRLATFFSASVTLLILAQLMLGSTMRHEHAGLAIRDFPSAYGKVWPATDAASVAQYNAARLEVTEANPITAFQIELQMAHRIGAMAILGGVGACAWWLRRSALSTLTRAWFGLILCQVVLGAATIWSNKAADIATGHVLIGALSLAMGATVTMLLFRAARATSTEKQASRPSSAGFGHPESALAGLK
jgi:cytochrome c oxidase assembly protein subunit 15